MLEWAEDVVLWTGLAWEAQEAAAVTWTASDVIVA